IDDRLDALAKKLRAESDWEKLVDLMLGRVGVEPSVERRAEMLLDVARIFEHEVGDLSKAFTALMAAYKEHPRVEAWNELERLASATGMWSDLLSELAEVMPTLPDGERAQAWLRIARLYGDKLNQAEYALHSLDEALKLEPELADAAELRITLYKRMERWAELTAALEAAGRFVEQAEVLESRLGDATQAAAAYRKALEQDPLQHEARAALETLLRKSGEWRALVTVLDERVQYATVEEARALKAEAAALFADRLDDRKQAIVRYEALAAEDPRDLTVLRALERLYSADGQEAQYIECLGRQAEAVESDRERAALYRRMASLWEEIPGSSARAEECLEKLLAVDPRSEDALRSLERLYYAERKWVELIDACRRHAALVPPPNAGEIHFQVAAIYEHELRELDKAIDAYLEVETLLPNHADTMEALTRAYEKTAQWQKAADVIERRAQLAEVKSQRLELHYQAGEIYAEKLGDAKAAESRFVRALEIDPTHVPAMTALVEIYRKNGDFLKAAKLLVEAVPHTPNRLERTRLLVEAGEIYDGLDDQRKATELYLDALAVDPEHVEAGERVAELLWKAERYTDLVPVLEMLTRKEAEPALQVERLTRLAHAAHALGLDDKVGKAYARAAELDESHLEAQRGRAAWHQKREEWQDALAALEKVFEHHVEDLPPSERVELYYGLGECALKLGDKQKAKERIAKALELDPAHRPSLLVSLELGEAKP
ncbi:MAG TPA: tetratricopeptide repeat protein, partial [Polyangia bacterium]